MRRGLLGSRSEAQAAIIDGRVTVGGAPALKAARLVGPAEPIELLGDPPRFVSRAGQKLEAALDRFPVQPQGQAVLDIGASTGGFTDCVLQRGARRVLAVDVGHNQLHERLVADDRVVNLERTNARELAPAEVEARLGERPGLVVADVSFISLALVAGPAFACARDGADYVMLIKPQFEAGRRAVSRGKGVVSDPDVWREVLDSTRVAFGELGAAIIDVMASPLTGTGGNVEFLAWGQVGQVSRGISGEAVERAVREGIELRRRPDERTPA